MKNIDKSKPVMITGATGYVAGWIVKELLEGGFTIHAPVRDPENKEKLKYLDKLAENSEGEIRYFKADLLEEGSYDEAMKTCELVFHTASPFFTKVKDAQSQLVDPALKGTRNVLASASKTSTVKRVVLTSSVAAIYGDAVDLLDLPNKTITEDNWNTTSNLKHQAYSYSKTLAEKEAWNICDKQKQWDLVVINPSFVIGPGINPFGTSESFNIVKQMGDGSTKMGIPSFVFGLIDVRDLAKAHLKAGLQPESNGRNIISNECLTLFDLAKFLADEYGSSFPFPKNELPKAMVWLMGPIFGIKREMVSKNVGYPLSIDNSKSIQQMKMQYRPAKESIVDFFQQMIDNGIVKAKK